MDDNEKLVMDVLGKAWDLWIASTVKDVEDFGIDADFAHLIRQSQALVLFRAYRRALKQPSGSN